MKQLALTLTAICPYCGLTYAGLAYSGKEMKQVAPAPCPQWYSDNEWKVSLWGTYAMTGTEFAPNLDLFDLVEVHRRGTPFMEPSIDIWVAIMPGAVASTSSTFSAVISALVLRDLS
jgi:hypothetical protein